MNHEGHPQAPVAKQGEKDGQILLGAPLTSHDIGRRPNYCTFVLPLRDRGKPSPGRRPPPLRASSKLASRGSLLVPLALSCAQEVQQSIKGDRKHPFSGALLAQTRRTLAEAINLNQHKAEVVAEGQPFHLNLITALATWTECIPRMSCRWASRHLHGFPQASGLLRRNSKGQRGIASMGRSCPADGQRQLAFSLQPQRLFHPSATDAPPFGQSSTRCLQGPQANQGHPGGVAIPSGTKLDGEWWINKVGTYGKASAQLYWLPYCSDSAI